MIKVCHIVNLITGKSDGVYSHLKMIFQNYDRNKFQHYLIFQGGEKVEKEITDLGIKVITSNSLRNKLSLKTFYDIYKVINHYEIDIIHTHMIKPYAIAGLINIFTRKKFIFNYHGLFLIHNPYYNFIEKTIYSQIHYLIYLFGKVDVVLVPSRKSKKLLLKETNLFPEPVVYYNGHLTKMEIINNRNDIVNFLQNIENSKIKIALIGRLEVDKRIDNAIKIVKRLTQQSINVNLLIFGDGILKNQLIKMSSELGISSRVIFFDYVPDVVNYLKFIDILLFTSDWEGMPLSMWEAMANQVPVVAPDVGGFREILEENDCGLIYEPGNLKDAEEKILQLINDEQLRTKLGQNGKSAIEAKYNKKEFIQQIERVYFQLISQ
jgi:glycosyltransferase involved in cell wall biosynthesis